jgi:hypothetical protein
MYHIFLIHSSIDGHLGCFHVLAIVHSDVTTNHFADTSNVNNTIPLVLLKVVKDLFCPKDCVHIPYHGLENLHNSITLSLSYSLPTLSTESHIIDFTQGSSTLLFW